MPERVLAQSRRGSFRTLKSIKHLDRLLEERSPAVRECERPCSVIEKRDTEIAPLGLFSRNCRAGLPLRKRSGQQRNPGLLRPEARMREHTLVAYDLSTRQSRRRQRRFKALDSDLLEMAPH